MTKQTFETPNAISVVLDVPAGRVEFIAGDRSHTSVVVGPADAGKGRDVKAAERVTVEYGDGSCGSPTRPTATSSSGPPGPSP
ncbi:hypothetical protein [Asanoa siamensis]|uniref:hypothetical protein n=1 Tax=Asanoa siamensis TaxID=926357 RepID=UPI0027E4C2CF|nr:hypothetical protein [Asanoa siamensis]